jgi:hypothetical protein
MCIRGVATTRYAYSSLGELDEAIRDLQKREGAPVRDRVVLGVKAIEAPGVHRRVMSR